MDAVRSAIQPITQSLPIQVHDFGGTLIGDACYKALVLDVDLSNTDCLKLAVSKGLGIGIIAASSVVKVPQIIKLVRSRSASGVSFLSYLLETSSYLISLAYNIRNGFPFSTFGETALILGQNVIITVLVLNYAGRTSAAAVFVAVLAAAVITLFSDRLLPMGMLSYLQAGAGVLGVASKVPQIAAIWQQGGTGQLSAFTVSSSFGQRMPLEREQLANLSNLTGLQLSRRLALAYLHDITRGGRQADPVWVRGRVRPERRACCADGVLLGRAVGQGQGQAEGEARGHAARSRSSVPAASPGRRVPLDGRDASQEQGSNDASEGLDAKRCYEGFAGLLGKGAWGHPGLLDALQFLVRP
jgi:mannose-P-dolichol utilization defect protein 1